MNIQPAGVVKRSIGSSYVAFLRVQATERKSRAIVPPIMVREIFDETQSGVGSSRFTKNFGFKADDFPNIRVRHARVLKNSKGRFVVFRLMSKTGEVDRSDPRARVFPARLRGGPCRRIEHGFGLGPLARAEKEISEIVARDRIIGGDLEHAPEHLLGGGGITAISVNLSEIGGDPRARAACGKRALVKRFLVYPIAAAHNAANAKGNYRHRYECTDDTPIAHRQIKRAAGEKNQEPDARQVEPMLSDRRIQLDDIGNRQITSEKPACTEDARRLTGTFFCAAADQSYEDKQSNHGQVFDTNSLSPVCIAAACRRIEYRAFHVQIAGKNHQATVIAERSRHQHGAKGPTPACIGHRRRALFRQITETHVDREERTAAGHRPNARAKPHLFLDEKQVR